MVIVIFFLLSFLLIILLEYECEMARLAGLVRFVPMLCLPMCVHLMLKLIDAFLGIAGGIPLEVVTNQVPTGNDVVRNTYLGKMQGTRYTEGCCGHSTDKGGHW